VSVLLAVINPETQRDRDVRREPMSAGKKARYSRLGWVLQDGLKESTPEQLGPNKGYRKREGIMGSVRKNPRNRCRYVNPVSAYPSGK